MTKLKAKSMKRFVAFFVALTMVLCPALIHANESEVYLDEEAKIEFLTAELERIDEILEGLHKQRVGLLERIDELRLPECPAQETSEVFSEDENISDKTSEYDETVVNSAPASDEKIEVYLENLSTIDAQIEYYEALRGAVAYALAELMQLQHRYQYQYQYLYQHLYQSIMPLGFGQEIPLSAFQMPGSHLNVELALGARVLCPENCSGGADCAQPGVGSSDPCPGNPSYFNNAMIFMNIDFALMGHDISKGDFFYIDLYIDAQGGFNISTGSVFMPPGAPLSAYIVREPANSNIVRVRVTVETAADPLYVSGRAGFGFNMTFNDYTYVEVRVEGYIYKFIANPPFVGGSGWAWWWPHMEKNGTIIAATGIIPWHVRMNAQGLSASNYFEVYGLPVPEVIRIYDAMSATFGGNELHGMHNLIPWAQSGAWFGGIPATPASDFNGYIHITSINLKSVWEIFTTAAAENTDATYLGPSTPVRNMIVNFLYPTGPHTISPINFNLFVTPVMTPQGGFALYEPTMTDFVNRLRFQTLDPNGVVVAAPAHLLPLVRRIDVPITVAPDGSSFYFDLPTHYFDYSLVTMIYATQIDTAAPRNTYFTNRLRFEGEYRAVYPGEGSVEWLHGAEFNSTNINIRIIKSNYANQSTLLEGAVFTIERRYGTIPDSAGAINGVLTLEPTNADGLTSTLQGFGAFGHSEVFILREITSPSGFTPLGMDIEFRLINFGTPANPDFQIVLEDTAHRLFDVNGDGKLVVFNDPVGQQLTPNVSITKSAVASVGGTPLPQPINVVPGDTVIYRLRVENTGNTNLNGLVVTDTLPAGLTNPRNVVLPTNATGGFGPEPLSAPYTLEVTLASLPHTINNNVVYIYFEADIAAGTLPSTIVNTATVIYTPSEGQPLTRSDTETVIVIPEDSPGIPGGNVNGGDDWFPLQPPGSGQNIPGGQGQNVPGDDTVIRDPDPPLGEYPQDSQDSATDITDTRVPLGNVPQTDATGGGTGWMFVSLLVFTALVMFGKNPNQILNAKTI